MNRLQAGFIAGGAGAVIIALLGLTGFFSFFGPIAALLVGIGAGILVGRNPAFAGRSAGAGALAGLLAGGLLFVGQIIAGAIFVNSSGADTLINSALQTVGPTLTASAGNNSSGGLSNDQTVSAVKLTYVGLHCFIGLLDLGLATGLAAAAAAIAGRNLQPAVMPFGVQAPYGAQPPQYGSTPAYPPSDATPNQPPSSGYGSSSGYQPPSAGTDQSPYGNNPPPPNR